MCCHYLQKPVVNCHYLHDYTEIKFTENIAIHAITGQFAIFSSDLIFCNFDYCIRQVMRFSILNLFRVSSEKVFPK